MPREFTGVRGDLCLPLLGLGESDYRDLCARTTSVVHCAASTSFAARPDVIRAANQEATKRVLEFASDAEARLIHVSTAFVERIAPVDHAIESAAEPDIATGISAYLHSKSAAEGLVKGSGIPFTIVRPSLIMGRSDSGEIARFQGLHLVIAFLFDGKIALLPAFPTSLGDFVPCDIAGLAVSRILQDPAPRTEYWITAGEKALTLKRLLDLTVGFAEENGRQMEVPRFVSPDVIDRLVRPVFLEHLSRSDRRRFEFLLGLLALFDARNPFPTDAPLLAADIDFHPEEAHLASLGYWAAKRGLIGEVAPS